MLRAATDACKPSALSNALRSQSGSLPFPRVRRATSNFRMAESKISMRAMHVHNKIALSLGAVDAILRIN
jgi:hypothetical protein